MFDRKSTQVKAVARSILVVVEACGQMQRALEEVRLTLKNKRNFFSIDAVKSFIFVFSIILLISISGRAQQNNNWFFGSNAALTFNPGPGPIPLSGSALVAEEGCSSISDSSGHTLFYTNGRGVWNKNNALMAGLSTSGLKGDPKATQSALIVPWPGSGCLKYLIFTVDSAANLLANGLRYSVVDFTNNPLGVVTTQDVLLMQPVAEKLTAVSDGSGGFWVIVHGYEINTNNPGNEDFYAYNITSTGPPFTMKPSHTGSPHGGYKLNGTTHVPQPIIASAGQMKVSPNGKLLACASWKGGNFVEVFDFDTTTGTVGGIVKKTSPNQFANKCPYGIEFSPLNSKLYVSTTGGGPTNELFQFDPTQAPLVATPVASVSPALSINSGYDFGALQLGPDGNIYMARVKKKSLDIISNADSPSCTYTSLGTPPLPTGSCELGLPNFIQGPFSCDPPACSMVASSSSSCCLGQDAQGNPIYAFLIPVSFQSGTQSCNLTLTTPQGTIVSYGPTTLLPGTTMVTGTVTVTNPAPASLCFTLKCMSGNVVNCTTNICVAPPPCAGTPKPLRR